MARRLLLVIHEMHNDAPKKVVSTHKGASIRDLSKRKLGQFSKALFVVQRAFCAELDKLANEARHEILPYFKKHGLDFRAGNGSWIITRVDEENGREAEDYEVLVDDDELPKNIRDLLMLEVARADYLGFYVRDIKRGEW